MSKMNKLFTFLLVLSGLLLLMLATNPYDLHFSILVVPFLLVGVMVYIFINLLLIDILKYRKRPSHFAAIAVTLTVVFLLSLSSLKQLTLLDFMLTLSFSALISWYVKRYFFSV